ncbi:glutaredoxin-like isoform X1 [Andrographis paniculata]|uniref:glutaredoxin-like isoform X1 n=1 Tax=Andrographis paniculata TaxID=175694 RepID=UPI0021E98000|nr:glutaredoxin-like isoform X1 [Andrographis paniculata]XP_051136825.1 glutaredoxin-like isoform X1 [Andrographis paniculata]
MGSIMSSMKREDIDRALAEAKEIVSSNPVVVFSKTYCGFCNRVKQLLSQLEAKYKLIELDEESDGNVIQTALAEWTGQRTVPNVFINGKHIGGCDAVMAKHQQGQLVTLLMEAGATPQKQST